MPILFCWHGNHSLYCCVTTLDIRNITVPTFLSMKEFKYSQLIKIEFLKHWFSSMYGKNNYGGREKLCVIKKSTEKTHLFYFTNNLKYINILH